MDTISPEFRLARDLSDANCILGEWDLDEGSGILLHRPTRLLFAIFVDSAADPQRLSFFDISVRLAHVCDGHDIPADRLPAIACAGIYAFTILTERLEFIENAAEEDDEIPF